MDKSWDLLEYLKDPYLVWRFQNFFGVEKVKIVENVRGAKYHAKHIDDLKPKQVQSDIKNSPTSSIVSSDEDYLSSSGDENVSKNVVFYQINSWFWYFVFLFGTQLGDETYYSIFFCFWFWNIDGAVGRRVILVWNLVMYIGKIKFKTFFKSF